MIRNKFSIFVFGLIAIFYAASSFASPSLLGDVPKGPIRALPYGAIPIFLTNDGGTVRWLGAFTLHPTLPNKSTGTIKIYEEGNQITYLGNLINEYNYTMLSSNCNSGDLGSFNRSGSFRIIINDFISEVSEQGVEIFFNHNKEPGAHHGVWTSIVYLDDETHVRRNNDECSACVGISGVDICNTYFR